MDSSPKVMRPRVLIITPEPTDALGGMEHAVRELETGLDRLGYAVVEPGKRGSCLGRPARKQVDGLRRRCCG
jgi:hypothetical protein